MKLWNYIFGLLILTLSVVVIAVFQLPDGNLHIIACNVGQGDAILATYENIQILTDGGPDKSVVTCLGKYMPFWDRNIELVISSHSDADHVTGLTEVIKNYKVEEMLINPIDPGTQVYELLRKEVGGRGVSVINPVEGMKLRLGLIYLDILEPADEVINSLVVVKEGDSLSKYSISGTANLYSIVYKLSFGSFTGLMPGDMPPVVSDMLANEFILSGVEWIKIPHHGSKNGLTENLLRVLMPKIGIISVGKNSWGFPNQEILDLLSKYNVETLRTDQVGDIEVITDGKGFWVR